MGNKKGDVTPAGLNGKRKRSPGATRPSGPTPATPTLALPTTPDSGEEIDPGPPSGPVRTPGKVERIGP